MASSLETVLYNGVGMLHGGAVDVAFFLGVLYGFLGALYGFLGVLYGFLGAVYRFFGQDLVQ